MEITKDGLDLVRWKVRSVIAGVPQTEEFDYKGEALDFYQELRQDLQYPNDKVVIYRLKYWGTQGPKEGKAPNYQDIYKSEIMDDRGNLIAMHGRSPLTWQEAERKLKYVKGRRKITDDSRRGRITVDQAKQMMNELREEHG